MAGRALRPFKDKKNCIIIDHGGNTMRHGLIDEEREVSLDGDKGREYPPRLTTCFKCNHIHQEKACPECGHENKKPKPLVSTEEKKYLNDMQIAEGDLEEVDLVKILERRKSEIEYFRECIRTQCNKGLKTGFSKVQFMQKFGRWPGKEIGVMPIWGTGYSGGPPKGYRFQGVEYLDK
jgi:DNA repair protein RadD